MEQNQGSFFDKKTIIAVILTGVVFLGWQKYLTSKYPNYGKTAPTQTTETTTETAAPTSTEGKGATKPGVLNNISPEKKSLSSKAEQVIRVETPEYSLDVSSKGLSLKNIVLKKYTGRDSQNIKLAQSLNYGLFELQIAGQPIDFDLSSTDGTDGKTITGVAQMGSMTVKRVLIISSNYSLKSRIEVQNPAPEFKQFEIIIPEKHIEGKGGSFLSPSLDFQEIVVKNSEKSERINLSTTKEDVIKSEGLNNAFGISSHYFATGFVNHSELTPEIMVESKLNDSELKTAGVYKVTSPQAQMFFEGTGYFGPKDFKIMEAVQASTQEDFTYFVNFGFFGGIGKILLKTLQFFHEYTIPNWGVAIILLTLLVRLLVLPFNVFSFKSMKKMQLIQPKIAALRVQYKDDSQTLNTEMMKLMKDQKVNPLGGCLPMLLQMPVFFALYQVLGQSIELYQAPFFGWIQDLSLKDPFFVTPVLMGLAMWYNQKITPNTMDPAQAKVMQFLPLVFSFMMIALPSGLTLYIFVSTIFGIIQQQIFMKDRSTTAKV